MNELIGIGVYTPREASRLLGIGAGKLRRWVHGHIARGRSYEPLWRSEVDLGDEKVYLGFRDIMEARVVDGLIKLGLSAQRIRTAIDLAKAELGEDRPLSTHRFKTDGRHIFMHVIEADEEGAERERLLNLFSRQYEFKQIIDPLLKAVDFDDSGVPHLWWPLGRAAKVVVDPTRAFGQPIEQSSSVPTKVLVNLAKHNGPALAARCYDVTESAVRRAIHFEASVERRSAA
jgi:uncharacterized protein (DUF433 family)